MNKVRLNYRKYADAFDVCGDLEVLQKISAKIGKLCEDKGPTIFYSGHEHCITISRETLEKTFLEILLNQ